MRAQAIKKLGIVELPKKAKYNNKKTFADNMVFDSIKEAERYGELVLLEKSGGITAFSTQVNFTFSSGVTYRADFVYYDITNKEWVTEDSKGVRTKEYRIKKKLMKEIGINIKET